MKRLIATVLMISLVMLIAGCKKAENKPQLPPGHPTTQGEGMQTGTPDMPKVERAVVVPSAVKAKWKAVTLNVMDKTSKNSKEYRIKVGSELPLPGGISVKVLAFLPDFRMTEKDITSASDKPNNPAVQVAVREKGKKVWTGWLYSMYPDVHPFAHDKVSLTLMNGVN